MNENSTLIIDVIDDYGTIYSFNARRAEGKENIFLLLDDANQRATGSTQTRDGKVVRFHIFDSLKIENGIAVAVNAITGEAVVRIGKFFGQRGAQTH